MEGVEKLLSIRLSKAMRADFLVMWQHIAKKTTLKELLPLPFNVYGAVIT